MKLIEFAVGGLLLFGAIILTLVAINSDNVKNNSANDGNSSNTSTQTNSMNMNRRMNSNGAVVRNSGSSSSVVGRKGRLTMNLNIRNAPNQYAEILGTHYQDARAEVTDSESYSTTEGYATWYKVKVLKDGCDQVRGLGCGNNWERNGSFGWMEAETEGWMNGKYIVLE